LSTEDTPGKTADKDQEIQTRERLLKVLLTSDARQRLTNIKMVKPEVAKAIENTIIQLASSGRVKKAVSDEEIKEYLTSMQQPQKNFKIKWA